MKRELTVDLEDQQIRSVADVKSVDKEKRTIQIVWSTGYRGLRRGWDGPYYEELSMKDNHVRLDRLNSHASVLNTHDSWDLRSVIGVVEKAWLKNGKGYADIRLSAEEADAPIVNKILDKIIRNVSVGYKIYKMVEVERVDEVPVYRAEDWEPTELSFVPVGFDPKAQSRAGEHTKTPCIIETSSKRSEMDELEKLKEELRLEREAKAAAEEAKRKAEEALKSVPDTAEAVRLETQRASQITELALKHKVDAKRTAEFISAKKTLEEVRAIILDEIAAKDSQKPTRSGVATIGTDEHDHLRNAAEESLLVRVAPAIFKPTEVSARFRSSSLLEIVRSLVEASGVRTHGMNKSQIAERGFHTTTDFPLLLGNSLRKTLQAQYATQPSDYEWMTRVITVNDYKPLYRYGLSQGLAFKEVKEHGEYEQGTLAENGETMAIKKYGRIFSVTREMLINDDLGAFSDLSRKWAFGAAQLKAKLVWEQIVSNPTMGDGIALFNAAHGNLVPGAPALDETSLEAAITLLENQKGFSAPDEDVQYLGFKAKYLVVATNLKFTALRLTTRVDAVTTQTVNLFSDLIVKSDPRLPAGSWYVSADPKGIDAIGILQMEGEEGPQLSEQVGFIVDGIDYKARFDIAAKVLDSKWIVKGA